jgi:hypothetical protein
MHEERLSVAPGMQAIHILSHNNIISLMLKTEDRKKNRKRHILSSEIITSYCTGEKK